MILESMHLEFLKHSRRIRWPMNIKKDLGSQASTQKAVDWIKNEFSQLEEVRIVEAEEEAISDSDILIAGTSTSSGGPSGFPYFKKEHLKPAALLLMPARLRPTTQEFELYYDC